MLDIKRMLFILLVGMLSLNRCTAQTDKAVAEKDVTTKTEQKVKENKVLSASEFKTAIAKTDHPQLVDVRTPQEFSEGNIAGAVNININDNDFMTRMLDLDKNSPVYVYCRSGARSARAAHMLEAEGFTRIYDLAGGFMNYK